MRNFGYKIVDLDAAAIKPVILDSLNPGRPLEIGLYFANNSARQLLADLLDEHPHPAVNTHLNHHKINVFNANETMNHLRQQIDLSLSLRSSYSITHISRFPLPTKASRRRPLAEKLLANLQRIEGLCREYRYPIFIENTYHGLNFYRRLFKLIEFAELRHIHFCFDIGHAKVWSGATLEEWFTFLQELQDKGTLIHFHLHANRGLSDEHLSFVQAESLGITGPDEFTEKWDYFTVLNEIDWRFPESRKVFEVPAKEAIENLALIEKRLYPQLPAIA
jgi:sugar phosphate isomerase/epimerase